MNGKYNFIENKDLYNFALSMLYFNEAKKEKEVFELWHKGENNCNIAKEIGFVEGTVRNRKKEIAKKYNELLEKSKFIFFD